MKLGASHHYSLGSTLMDIAAGFFSRPPSLLSYAGAGPRASLVVPPTTTAVAC